MSDAVISVDSVSKLYRLGTIGTGTLAHDLNRWWCRVRGKDDPYAKVAEGNDRSSRGVSNYVWALKDVSFEVKRGEVLGIIGRNGAGKSTLLKILSRVTTPTSGQVKLRGRVASLLEVGTGFHPELTGRENVYLNGAIMGMRKAEVDRRFDEIVAFSGVDRYVDTPVKRYSSGMYVRLAFAVAAHLEPDILVVDEVLAVGDAEFQKRCLGKMHDVSGVEGRTVLFVSHNLASIRALTGRCLLLDEGRLEMDGQAHAVIERYLEESTLGALGAVHERHPASGESRPFFVRRISTRREPGGECASQFDCDHPVFLCLEYASLRRVSGLYGYMILQRTDGTVVYEGDSYDSGNNVLDAISGGQGTIVIKVPPRILAPGKYQLFLNFTSSIDGANIDSPGLVCEFQVSDHRTRRGNRRNGHLSLVLDWQLMETTLPPIVPVVPEFA